ncbi:DNA-processing protein DprA [Serpentinicella sp. ANB-PHB4]|uniref:DNA-processing protein DprA n=1 Tax=Serpentinicella sp. ANB-PHB4 TaxID=3074076 RepID=UPI0028620544|nr:DNA-processing protein DprA [Serpentinicella sp. ANB-PHB4]MDR5658277.1 DNA-processing protein DprA [Serpentinicella sp. ANB-PHB4]
MLVNDRNILIWFNYLGSINFAKIQQIESYFGSLQEFWKANDKHIHTVFKKQSIIAQKIQKNRNNTYLNNIIESITNKDFKTITILDEGYPEKLKQIDDPPYVIYIKGEKYKYDKPLISIVGSRKATPYGNWAAYKFAKELAELDIIVASGLASGIDASAHRGCLDGEGFTVAVLGCGIDQCYPASNKGLMNRVLKSGVVLTEYPPGTLPLKHHFPARNRIISGLSDGIVIIEAAKKSGSLITAEFGLEQGKEIYALPGNINNTSSEGTNKLIKDGAKILLSAEDITEELSIKYDLRNNKTSKDKVDLSPLELNVLNTIKSKPIHIDMLCYETEMNISELNTLLTILQLKGYISQLPGKVFTAVK